MVINEVIKIFSAPQCPDILRMTGALIDWSFRYPGDLQNHETKELFREILTLLSRYPFMGHLTAELVLVEESLADGIDIDISWSYGSNAVDVEVSGGSAIALSSQTTGVAQEQLRGDGGSSASMRTSRVTPSRNGSMASSKRTSSSSLILPPVMQRKRSAWELLGPGIPVDFNQPLAMAKGEPIPPDWSSGCALVLREDPEDFAKHLARIQLEIFKTVRVSHLSSTTC